MDPFFGEIRPLAFYWPPQDWALCDGSLISIAQNPALAAVIGISYGGDGKNTIGLPNLQGRVPVGMGSGLGLTSRPIASTGGVETVTLSAAQMAPHQHPINSMVTGMAADLSATPDATKVISRTFNQWNYSTTNINPWTTTAGFDIATIGPTGDNPASPHNNMQPWLCINFCIALNGVFPLRP
jgi:microcystin-dependent protein